MSQREPIRKAPVAALTLEALRAYIASLIHVSASEVGERDDLLSLGLDSLQAMHVAAWLRDAGAAVSFADLAGLQTPLDWFELAQQRAGRMAPVSAPIIDVGEPFGLDSMQRAYWIGRGAGQVLASGCHFYFEFDGVDVDPQRLEQALRALVARHGMLRVEFLPDGTQRIAQGDPWPGLVRQDLVGLCDAEAQARLEALRERMLHQSIEVEKGRVLDVAVSLREGGRVRTHVAIDMLAVDAASFTTLLAELDQLYRNPGSELPALHYTFPQYLRDKLVQPATVFEEARAYWQGRLDALPGPPGLPLARLPESIDARRVERLHAWLPSEVLSAISRGAARHGATPSMALLAAFAETLACWSETPQFLINLPVFDRAPVHPDVSRIVGEFTNLVLLAADLSQPRTFADRMKDLQTRFRADLAHSAYSGVDVLRDLSRRRGGRAAAPVVFTSTLGLGDLFASVRDSLGKLGWMASQTAQVWIDLQAIEHDAGLLLNLDTAEGLFPEGLIGDLFAGFVELLSWLARSEDWAQPIPGLLGTATLERRRKVNDTAARPSGLCLHERFFSGAARYAEHVALCWGETQQWTYAELAQRALSLAGLLVERGVRPGDTVAICLARGREQVVAVLGTLAAGATYVPVSIALPEARRRRIQQLARARLLLTSLTQTTILESPTELDVVLVEDAASVPPLEKPVALAPDASAYVIFTSGSTGEPKGVEVQHHAAVNTIEDLCERFSIGPADRALAVSALDFDLSVFDIFAPLSTGAALVLTEVEQEREAREWVALARRWGVTIWNSVPALLDMLVSATRAASELETLRLVMVSGDWVRPGLVRRLRERNAACRFVALGGATEASIWSNAFEVEMPSPAWSSIPYGRPLRNQKFRVVDWLGRDRPDWVAGELWIGGLGVAKGYRGDCEQTSRKFVALDGERWYRTGDLGRYWPDAVLEFLGRVDQQVKIRGHRIELGEIEVALLEHPGVARALVSAVGEPRRLVALVVAATPELRSRDLESWLADRLPRHAIPSSFGFVDQLPLTANGKLDRQAAEALSVGAAEVDAAEQAPTGRLEIAIAELWRQLLGVESVGRSQNFIELGGDSILATRLVEELARTLDVELSLRQLFSAPTVAELANLVERMQLERRHDSFEEGAI